MKKFELFMYTDRNEDNGEYIGRTRRYEVMAETDKEAMSKGYRENRWARGCWCSEVREEETFGVEFKVKCYGNHILSEGRVSIRAKNREQAIRYYNNEIKGKRFNSYRTSEFREDGDVECGAIQEVYICGGNGQFNATNY